SGRYGHKGCPKVRRAAVYEPRAQGAVAHVPRDAAHGRDVGGAAGCRPVRRAGGNGARELRDDAALIGTRSSARRGIGSRWGSVLCLVRTPTPRHGDGHAPQSCSNATILPVAFATSTSMRPWRLFFTSTSQVACPFSVSDSTLITWPPYL